MYECTVYPTCTCCTFACRVILRVSFARQSVPLVCKEQYTGRGSVVSCICDFGTAGTSRQHQRVLSLVLPSSRRTKITLRARMRSVLLSKEPPPSAVDGTLSCCTALAPCYLPRDMPLEIRRETKRASNVKLCAGVRERGLGSFISC